MPFDRPTFRTLLDALQSALNAVGKKLGVQITVGRASYTETLATIKLEAGILGADGVAESGMEADFKRLAVCFGLQPTDLQRSFTEGTTTWKIIGLKPRSRQYPVIGANQNGKRYKLPAAQVMRGLAAAGAPAVPPTKRTDAAILDDLRRVEDALSPENLTCGGQASRSYVRRRAAERHRRKRALLAELGRTPTEEELYPGVGR